MTLHIDFETRGTLDLKAVGLYRYARHSLTDVWCMGWAYDAGSISLWTPATDASEILQRVANGECVVAHNAQFELQIWNSIMVPRYGWPVLRPEQTYCTMAQCYAMNLPGALEDAALALGLDARKDTEGRALMLRMARPRHVNGSIVTWWDDPEKLERLYSYCRQDVRVERALDARLMPLSDYERRVWLMDYEINSRGIKVDSASARASIDLAEAVKASADETIADLTHDKVEKHTALLAMKQWMADEGVPVTGLAKQDIIDLLEQSDLPPAVRTVLEIRQEVGKASVAKLDKMLELAYDDRVYFILQYHGAGTGRWAGRGLQPHNFIRDVPAAEDVELALRLVREGNYQMLQALYGPPLSMVSRCLRSFFVASEGKTLIVGDFSAIEGRGTAWVSGEHWKVQAFVAADEKRGPGIYELTYAKAFGVPIESVKNPSKERQIGKVMELLLGYQGGIGALRRGGGALVADESDDTLNDWKLLWRGAHKNVVRSWYGLQEAAINAVQNPGQVFSMASVNTRIDFKVAGSFLWCKLPSGRCLCYPYPKILEGKYGPQLTYMTVPSSEDAKAGRVVYDEANSPKWARVSTYGGSLMENVVQAICRDLLVWCMLKLHGMGAQIVLHVHDEIVIEVDIAKAEKAREIMEDVMRTAPTWAEGFPLWATPAIMRRYGK